MKVFGLFVIVIVISVFLFVEAEDENLRKAGKGNKGKGSSSGSSGGGIGTDGNTEVKTPEIDLGQGVKVEGSKDKIPPIKTRAGKSMLESCSDMDLVDKMKNNCVGDDQMCIAGKVCCSGKCGEEQSEGNNGSFCTCRS